MGMFVNLGNQAFQVAVNSEISLTVTESYAISYYRLQGIFQ